MACHKTRGQWERVLDLDTPLAPPNLAWKIWVWDLGTAWAARPWVLATVGTVGTDRAEPQIGKERDHDSLSRTSENLLLESTSDPVESRKPKLETGSQNDAQRFVLDCQGRYLLLVGNSLYSCMQ
jgi:hypothetical protein